MEEDNQTVKQVIKMLVAVVVLFVLCWAPMLVVNLARGFHWLAQTNEGYLKEIVTGKWGRGFRWELGPKDHQILKS